MNLPPYLRYLEENFIIVCLIPSPNTGKNIDSWLHPLVQEMHSLDKGSVHRGFNQYTKKPFTLRAWLINVSADGKAMADANGIASPGNAIRPCHHCTIRATPTPKTKHYYVVHKKKHLNINQKLPYRHYLRPMVEKFDQISRKSTRKNMVSRLGKISILTPPFFTL